MSTADLVQKSQLKVGKIIECLKTTTFLLKEKECFVIH